MTAELLSPERICAVLVTYGARGHLLVQTVPALAENGLRRAVVVLNGAQDGVAETCLAAARDAAIDLTLVDNGDNLGSAGGYAAGISRALELDGVDAVLLLDDDNKLSVGALTAMLSAKHDAERALGRPVATAAVRLDRPKMKQVAAGTRPEQIFAPRSAPCGFDVIRLARRIIDRDRSDRPDRDALARGWSVIPQSIYGGLLVGRAALECAGLPRADFFVYADDIEFTRRLSDASCPIVLVHGAAVEDIEPSWFVQKSRLPSILRFATTGPDARIYYVVRNDAYLSSRASPLRFATNVVVLGGIWLVLCCVCWRWRRAGLLMRAFRDGIAGRLGKRSLEPLEDVRLRNSGR